MAPAAKSPVPFLDTARSIWRSHLTGDYLRRKDRAAALFLRHYGTRVLQGPFAGMNYLNRSHNSEFVPKLLGSYEAELSEVLEQIIAHDYRLIVDVGFAERYYAVGLARRCPMPKWKPSTSTRRHKSPAPRWRV